MRVVLEINDKLYKTFLSFIQTLDYVKIQEDCDEMFELSENQLQLLEERKESYLKEKSKVVEWEEVRKKLNKKK